MNWNHWDKPRVADKSLLFADGSSNRVEIADAASISNLTTVTVLMIILKPSPVTGGRRIWVKGLDTAVHDKTLRFNGTSGAIQWSISRATTAANVITSTLLKLDVWQVLAGTYSEANGPKIFFGGLTSPMFEAAYGTGPVVGSGATGNDSDTPIYIANRQTLNISPAVKVGFMAYFAAELTLSDIEKCRAALAQGQRIPVPFCVVNMPLGKTIGPPLDISGYNNHGVVTGATLNEGLTLSRLKRTA